MDHLSRVDFASLVRPASPNSFLLAPRGACAAARIDEEAVVYGIAAGSLRQAFLRVALAAPRVSHVLKDDVGLYDNLVVRSALFRFPDLVAARFFDVGDGCSTLAVYSRSVYGHSDLGVNARRIGSWVGALRPFAAPVSR
jgi:uncharacterized protein (DUF1499 family)